MRIQDTIIHLLLKQPFYGYIASSIVPVESSDVKTTRMVTDPSLKLLYNREWYEGLKDEVAASVILHEMLHLIFLHAFRKGNRDRCLWAVACDMAVNEHIDKGIVPQDAVTIEKISKELNIKIPNFKSAEFYYDIITSPDSGISFIQKDDFVTVALKDGGELNASNTMEGDSSEVNLNAFKSMFSELLEQAKSEGDVPSGMAGTIDEIYKRGEVNWRNVLKRFLSGKGKIRLTKTLKRESKRYEKLPGNKRTVGLSALLALDESGSVSDGQITEFYNEVLNIKRITGVDLLVTEFDTICSEPVPVQKYIKDKKRVKNGGTDFRPVFKLADRMRIPVVIIFTDGDGSAPDHVDQKVLWVLTKGGTQPAEYGYSVSFDS